MAVSGWEKIFNNTDRLNSKNHMCLHLFHREAVEPEIEYPFKENTSYRQRMIVRPHERFSEGVERACGGNFILHR